MKKSILLLTVGALALAGCAGGNNPDKSRDRQTVDSSGDLSNMQAGIWIAPSGCEYWIIDDGVEGYLSNRFDPNTGKPVCREVPPGFPGLATGNFKGGSTNVIGDPI